jgi:hypothetical protein
MTAVFVAAVSLFLVLPMLRHALVPHADARAGVENRRLAAAPRRPGSLADVARFTAEADAYFRDNFGFRDRFVRMNGAIWQGMLGQATSDQIVLGEQGRVFFGSHQPGHPYSLILEVCGVRVADEDIAAISREFAAAIEARRGQMHNTLIMIVPTAPALYTQQLPGWLRTQCEGAKPSVDRFIATLPQDARAGVLYPIAQMRQIKSIAEAIPRTNFHWYGFAPHRIAQFVARERLGKDRSLTIPERPALRKSDIGHLNPGAEWMNSVMEPDFTAAGVRSCVGLACLPEIAFLKPKFDEASRYVRRDMSAGEGRLLLLSDSFGAGIAGYFTEYFDEVVHLNVSEAVHLSSDQLDALRRWRAVQDVQYTILVVHDGALKRLPELVKLLWPDKPARQMRSSEMFE